VRENNNSWADNARWLDINDAAFRQLWAQCKPTAPPLSRNQPPSSGDADDAIDALVNHDKGNSELHLDEQGQ
jgi:hypothetical protein